MALGERRGDDLGPLARNPGGPPGRPGGPGRRGDRGRRIAKTGVAAVLAILSRHTVLPDEGRGQVEVETSNFHLPEYDRGDIDALIEEAAAAHGVSVHLVRAVVQAESAFDPRAVSPVGAQGLMQLMPGTATLMGVGDPLDARQNVFGGVKYLSQLLDRFDGNVALALAGYNAGPTRVARCRGIPRNAETHGYVTRIRRMLAKSTGALFPLPKRTRVAEQRGGSTDRRPRRSGHGRRT
jgi:transglycosylase-like protein with SLT domain